MLPRLAPSLLLSLALLACSRATSSPSTSRPGPVIGSAEAAAVADSVRHSYTPADVAFMSGMIHHHAQAITMARLAPSHGASPAVRVLTERIINAQKDEIVTMQQWLRDRGQPVPEPDPAGMKMMMGGVEHVRLMPGMLAPAQMDSLNAAHGRDFDRLFLKFMIQHHHGAVDMVHHLLSSYGAAQEDLIFKLASDINADQTTEITRMERMLAALAFDEQAAR